MFRLARLQLKPHLLLRTHRYRCPQYGTALGGSLRLFKALNNLFEKYFHAAKSVERNHIVAGTGCGTVIDLLVSVIADEGDGILVSLPHYNGFVSSFGCRNGVHAVGVQLAEGKEAGPCALEAYERKLVESEKAGVPIKAIMLCNPHNPLGELLSLRGPYVR